MAEVIIKIFILIEIKRIRGATFCQVKMINAWIHSRLTITWGNQKCSGAIPAFMSKEAVNKISVLSKEINSWIKVFAEAVKIIKIEAIACAIKYLILASEDSEESLLSIRGIILIKLISKPTQQVNHELADTAVIEPLIRRIKNKIW